MPRLTNPLPQLTLDRLRGALARLRAEAPWERQRLALEVEGAPVFAIAEAPSIDQAAALPYQALPPGALFGPAQGAWHQRWCRVRVPEPGRVAGERLLLWDCQGETTAWIDGVPWCGLDDLHPAMPLPPRPCTVYLDVGLYPTSGMWVRRAIDRFGARFDGCALVVRDRRQWLAQYGLEVLEQLLRLRLAALGLEPPAVGYHPPLESVDPLTRQLLAAAGELCDAAETGIEELLRRLPAVFRQFPAEAWQPRALLVGHAHLDAVWLWPEAVAYRKALHSWSTMLRLSERWPALICQISQPALIKAAQAMAPGLVERMRELARAGRWELSGAFFVECDTNLPCGEALVRCLRLGQRALQQLSGRPSRLCWLPDAFGYSAALPQILKQSGVSYFFTTKLAWSAVTRFPYTSFVWRGHDGSEVIAHIAAGSAGYNGHAVVSELSEAAARHRQCDVHPELLCPTGHGDGGGGVSEDQLARAEFLSSLSGVPRAQWAAPTAFFDRLRRRRQLLPVWQGELYLEYHRGTYTSQAACKAAYRALERALQSAEAVRAVRRLGPLPDEDWERLCFAQFHDALPGSSIGLVYRQLVPELQQRAERLLAQAVQELGGGAPRGADGPWLVFNPLALERAVVVHLPGQPGALVDDEGRPLPLQRAGERTLVALRLPPLGAVQLRRAARDKRWAPLHAASDALDNGLVQARFTADGRLQSLAIGGERLALAQPAGLALYRDLPADFDAWDIDHHSLRRPLAGHPAMRLRIAERGAVRAVLAGRARLGEASSCVLRWMVERDVPWLLVELEIDWQERHRLLKFHCPTAYRGRQAWFGAPFGVVARSQQPGDAAAEAQWEVPGSRWAAVGDDDGRGLAIVSACSYGFSCRDGDLGLSLLRAPSYPDAEADRGRHCLRWAIGRHRAVGGDGQPATAAWADLLFTPPLIAEGGAALPPPLLACDVDGSLVPAWVEPLAGGACALRLHEVGGRRGEALLRAAHRGVTLAVCDLRGQALGGARLRRARDREAWLAHRPYGLYTIHAVERQR